jgi:7-carboxy-7-deazaguanine synthase
MKINEIFYSIQGEGKWTGLPNIFIRTTGCNLRCSFCDTTYAYTVGCDYEIQELIEEIKKYPCNFVCVTGGEPLIQDESIILVESLVKNSYEICLETNGSRDIQNFIGKKSLFISLDIKCPSSDMHEKMKLDNLRLLTEKDQLKFIIKNREDYEYAKKIIDIHKPNSVIYFQPVWKTDPRQLSSWILSDGLNVRIGFQIQKILWRDKKGV